MTGNNFQSIWGVIAWHISKFVGKGLLEPLGLRCQEFSQGSSASKMHILLLIPWFSAATSPKPHRHDGQKNLNKAFEKFSSHEIKYQALLWTRNQLKDRYQKIWINDSFQREILKIGLGISIGNYFIDYEIRDEQVISIVDDSKLFRLVKSKCNCKISNLDKGNIKTVTAVQSKNFHNGVHWKKLSIIYSLKEFERFVVTDQERSSGTVADYIIKSINLICIYCKNPRFYMWNH